MSDISKKSAKIKQKTYKRRKATLFKKAHELKKFCDVEIAMIIYKHNRYFTYKSTNQQSWSSFIEQIVSNNFF